MPTGLMLFDVVEVIGNLIQENIKDLNDSRPKNKWVFPQFPENDSNLPEVVVKLGQPTYENDSAGNVLYNEYDTENSVFKDYYYKKATVPLQLVVITQKATSSSIKVVYDNNELFLKNQPLNIFLTEQIKNMIWNKRSEILEYFDDFKLSTIEPSFDNNKWSWASIINCEIQYKDLFVNETDNDGIVVSYSLNTMIIES